MPRRDIHAPQKRIVVLSDIHLGDSRSTLQDRDVVKDMLDALLPKLGRCIVDIMIKLWSWVIVKRIKKDRGTEIDEIENEITDYLTLCDWDPQNPLRFIFGHSHVPGAKKIDDLTVINCGSWLQEDSRHNTYALIEGDALTLRKLGEKEPIFTTSL